MLRIPPRDVERQADRRVEYDEMDDWEKNWTRRMTCSRVHKRPGCISGVTAIQNVVNTISSFEGGTDVKCPSLVGDILHRKLVVIRIPVPRHLFKLHPLEPRLHHSIHFKQLHLHPALSLRIPTTCPAPIHEDMPRA